MYSPDYAASRSYRFTCLKSYYIYSSSSCVRHESVISHEMQRSLDVTLCPTYVCHLQSTKLQNSIDDTGKEVIGDALHGLDKYAQQKQQDDNQHQKKTDETLNKIAKVRDLGLPFASLAVSIC